jgi:hypothetical protein
MWLFPLSLRERAGERVFKKAQTLIVHSLFSKIVIIPVEPRSEPILSG